jgi:energy-coupling factor transporter ATP-binding protein EcfA2
MRRLNRERDLTFVIVTHDLAIGRQADRIIRMLDGRVVAEERPSAKPATPSGRVRDGGAAKELPPRPAAAAIATIASTSRNGAAG